MKYRAKEEIKNDPLTEKIIGVCFDVHKALGPGLKEKIYQNALEIAMGDVPLEYSTEKNYPVKYKDKRVGSLRVDLVIEGKVILEIKAISDPVPKVFENQILSYLKISGLKVGLLVNFGGKSCQVRRYVY